MRRDQTAAYDQMMAEIQLDSDDDEQQARRVQARAKSPSAFSGSTAKPSLKAKSTQRQWRFG